MMELIETITNVTAGTFDFTSIPATYDNLYIRGLVQSDRSATSDTLNLYFNNDTTTTNYHAELLAAENAAIIDVEDNTAYVGRATGATAPSNSASSIEIQIMGYTSGIVHCAQSRYTYESASGNILVGLQCTLHDSGTNTATINQLTILTPTGGAGLTGYLSLYGE